MRAIVEEISPTRKRLDVIIPQEKVSDELNTAYQTLRKRAKVKGFRAGKVPLAMLERMYKNEIESDLVNNLISESYPKALDEQKLHPLGMPSIEKGTLNRDKDFTYSAVFDVAPEIEPHDYLGMEIERKKFELSDEMVEKQLEAIRSAHAQLEALPEERAAKEEDVAIVNYQAIEDGQPVEGISNTAFPIVIGQHRFNEEVEKALVGMQKGEKKDVEVSFPADFSNAAVAGKTLTFSLEVVDIKQRKLPELDDDFAKDLGEEFATLDDLKKKIREQITQSEESRARQETNTQIRKKLVQTHEFEAPKSLIDYQIQLMMDNLERNLRQRGLNFESAGIVPEKLADEYRTPAEEQVKSNLVLESIAAKEGLEISDEDVDGELERIAFQIGQKREVIENFYRDNNMLEGLKNELLEQKTLQFIADHATVKEVESAEKTNE